MESNIIKVSSNSNPTSIAGVISALIKQYKFIELRAVGAGAVNQAVKAIAIARGYTAPNGIDLICIPAFDCVEINNEEKSIIKFIVKSEI